MALTELKVETPMKSSALQLILWALLILCPTVDTRAQTKTAKKESASVSGRVTIKGKATPGITVGLRSADVGWPPATRQKGTTDREGYYRITNVAPGSYQVMLAAPAFVTSGEPEGRTLIVSEGEAVEGVDFALTRGGVITGRITDSEGRPLIEEQIQLVLVERNSQILRAYGGAATSAQTDDRGIYRIFGIQQGKYIVAVGQSEDGFVGGPRRSPYKQTYHPAVTEAARARVIEVTEGSEATNVDIIVGRTLATFAVSGRIVNGETQQPVPNVRLTLQRIAEGHSFSASGPASNSQGEFKLENVMPGRYAIHIQPQANAELVAETVPFEVIDQEVTGLLLKTSPGASVSGTIVLEGTIDKSALARLGQLQVETHVAREIPGGWHTPSSINPDGSFRVGALQSGVAHFGLASPDRRRGFSIVRVERDGVAQPSGLEIKDGEQVTGVRLVVNYGNGTIRGIVKLENGELPSTARVGVWFTRVGDDPSRMGGSLPSPQVDSRGRFIVEGLAPGAYEINASVYTPDSRTRPPSTKQQVNVADGEVTEVTLTLSPGPTPGSGNP